MDRLWFVGFAEAQDVRFQKANGLRKAYQTSICLLHWRVYQSLPEHCDCLDLEKWSSFTPRAENQNSSYHGEARLSQLPRKTLKQIDTPLGAPPWPWPWLEAHRGGPLPVRLRLAALRAGLRGGAAAQREAHPVARRVARRLTPEVQHHTAPVRGMKMIEHG